MHKSQQARKLFSLILATGSALLLSLAVGAATTTKATAGETSDAPASEVNASSPHLWHIGLGSGPQLAAQTPPVSAAPPAAANASQPLLWHMGLGGGLQRAAARPEPLGAGAC